MEARAILNTRLGKEREEVRVGGGRRELLSRREGKENEIDLRGLKGKRKEKENSPPPPSAVSRKNSRVFSSSSSERWIRGLVIMWSKGGGEKKTRRFCDFPLRKLVGKMGDALWTASFGFFSLFLLPDLDSSYFSNGEGREAAKYKVAFCLREGTRSRQEDFEK